MDDKVLFVLEKLKQFEGFYQFPTTPAALDYRARLIAEFVGDVPEERIRTEFGETTVPAVPMEEAVVWLMDAVGRKYTRFPPPVEFRKVWYAKYAWTADGIKPDLLED